MPSISWPAVRDMPPMERNDPLRFLPLLVLTFLPAVAALAGPAETWPTKGWPVSTPEAQGLDGALLGSFDRELAAGQHGYVDGMLVIRHGSLVFEKSYPHDYESLFVGKGAPGLYNYYDPAWHPYWKRGELHTMQSVSKSVTSALVGIAMRRGEIPGVDAKVMPYFSAFKTKPDPRRDAMTLRDVLTMTTGIQWDESSSSYTNAKNNCAEMEAKDDWIQYVLDQPMAFDARPAVRVQQRRHRAPLVPPQEDHGQGGRRLREGAPPGSPGHRVRLEAHA